MANTASKPHVVVIMADQLRWDALGGRYTPNLNRLREESVAFNRAYCASPLCVPARGSFFSGRYPNETGCLVNGWEPLDAEHGRVRPGVPNWYQMMEDADWDSWHTGKQHYFAAEGLERLAPATHWHPLEGNYERHLKAHGKRKPGGPAFRGMVPEMAFGTTTRMRTYSVPTTGRYEEELAFFYDGYIADTSLQAMRGRDPGKPFLLNAMFLAPHPPLEIPEPWYSRWSAEEVELPDNVGVWAKNQSPLQLYNLTGAIGTRYSREDWKEIWRVYLGLVSLLDDCVGMLIGELKRQGIYDDTLIVFASDHGEMLGSHCLWQKMCMYEESARTPLYFKFPKTFAPAVRESDAVVSAVDVFPTLCEAVGLPVPDGVSGRSLMPIIRGETDRVREEAFIQFDGNGARGNFQRCVVQGEDKLIVDLFKDELYLELYRLRDDVQEQTNLAFDERYGPRIEELLQLLRGHMTRTGDLLSLPDDAYARFLGQYGRFRR